MSAVGLPPKASEVLGSAVAGLLPPMSIVLSEEGKLGVGSKFLSDGVDSSRSMVLAAPAIAATKESSSMVPEMGGIGDVVDVSSEVELFAGSSDGLTLFDSSGVCVREAEAVTVSEALKNRCVI